MSCANYGDSLLYYKKDAKINGVKTVLFFDPEVFPDIDEIMIGRGLFANPALIAELKGISMDKAELRERLKNWQLESDDVALIIGGPDGLDPEFKAAAHERIRLSDLTLPHAMVRVLLIEQLYRAWSVNAGHPYHRE